MTQTVRLLVVVLLVLAGIGVHVLRSVVAPATPDPERIAAVQRRLDALPMDLGDGAYVGRRRSHEQELVIKAGADSHGAASFTDKSREHQFSLYVGGSTQPDVAFHPPSICLPAAGWSPLTEELVDFEAFTPRDPDDKMRRLHLRLGEREMLCYFWFQSDDDVADSIWQARFFNFEERLHGEQNRPTFIVVVYAPIYESLRHTDQAARSFIQALGPPLLGALRETQE